MALLRQSKAPTPAQETQTVRRQGAASLSGEVARHVCRGHVPRDLPHSPSLFNRHFRLPPQARPVIWRCHSKACGRAHCPPSANGDGPSRGRLIPCLCLRAQMASLVHLGAALMASMGSYGSGSRLPSGDLVGVGQHWGQHLRDYPDKEHSPIGDSWSLPLGSASSLRHCSSGASLSSRCRQQLVPALVSDCRACCLPIARDPKGRDKPHQGLWQGVRGIQTPNRRPSAPCPALEVFPAT